MEWADFGAANASCTFQRSLGCADCGRDARLPPVRTYLTEMLQLAIPARQSHKRQNSQQTICNSLFSLSDSLFLSTSRSYILRPSLRWRSCQHRSPQELQANWTGLFSILGLHAKKHSSAPNQTAAGYQNSRVSKSKLKRRKETFQRAEIAITLPSKVI